MLTKGASMILLLFPKFLTFKNPSFNFPKQLATLLQKFKTKIFFLTQKKKKKTTPMHRLALKKIWRCPRREKKKKIR